MPVPSPFSNMRRISSWAASSLKDLHNGHMPFLSPLSNHRREPRMGCFFSQTYVQAVHACPVSLSKKKILKPSIACFFSQKPAPQLYVFSACPQIAGNPSYGLLLLFLLKMTQRARHGLLLHSKLNTCCACLPSLSFNTTQQLFMGCCFFS